jgi:hypothetical protein
VRLSAHANVAARAAEKTAKLEMALREAQQSGLLMWFNGEYKRRRLLASARGERFPPYTAMLRRLRSAVAAAIARGGVIDKPLLLDVFR